MRPVSLRFPRALHTLTFISYPNVCVLFVNNALLHARTGGFVAVTVGFSSPLSSSAWEQREEQSEERRKWPSYKAGVGRREGPGKQNPLHLKHPPLQKKITRRRGATASRRSVKSLLPLLSVASVDERSCTHMHIKSVCVCV